MKEILQNLIEQQCNTWALAKNNYAALTQVRVRELTVQGVTYQVQFNPARIVSSAAKVDAKSIGERPCFLCPAQRPAEQKGIPFEERYTMLVNPFPIFPRHLTITENSHVAQRIASRFDDMLNLAAAAREYVIFYNGPSCGASAPDHAHFQAGNRGFLPIEKQWEQATKTAAVTLGEATLWLLEDAPRNAWVIESRSKADAATLFHRIYNALEQKPNEPEPMMNLLAWFESEANESEQAGRYIICLFLRSQHRPSCFTAEGAHNRLISPASVDMGGVFITPRESDFEQLTATDVAEILTEVCLSQEALQPIIQRIQERKL